MREVTLQGISEFGKWIEGCKRSISDAGLVVCAIQHK